MCLPKYVPSNYIFCPLIQATYIAINHNSIVTESNWRLMRYSFLRAVFLFMAGLSSSGFPYKVYRSEYYLLRISRHYFFRIAAVKLLQPSSIFPIFPLNHYTESRYNIELYLILLQYRTISCLYTSPKTLGSCPKPKKCRQPIKI